MSRYRDVRESGHDDVRAEVDQMALAFWVLSDADNAPETGTTPGLDPCVCILQENSSVGRYAKPPERLEKQGRIGLPW